MSEVRKITLVEGVVGCPRCGFNHAGPMIAEELQRPEGARAPGAAGATHWTGCPITLQPVLVVAPARVLGGVGSDTGGLADQEESGCLGGPRGLDLEWLAEQLERHENLGFTFRRPANLRFLARLIRRHVARCRSVAATPCGGSGGAAPGGLPADSDRCSSPAVGGGAAGVTGASTDPGEARPEL